MKIIAIARTHIFFMTIDILTHYPHFLISDPKMGLIIPNIFYNGFSLGYLFASYTADFVQPLVGTDSIGRKVHMKKLNEIHICKAPRQTTLKRDL